MGQKTSSGSGGTRDATSAQGGGLNFSTPYGSANGWASASSGTTNSYSYTEQAYLDDNGTWQLSSGAGSVAASGWQNWSYSGGNSCQLSVYGNTDNGSLNASGQQSDSYQYSESYQLGVTGQWLAVSGAGSASGSESAGSGYLVSGGYSNPGPTLATPGSNWVGSTSASAGNSSGYGYLTRSVFTPASGWTSTGGATASNAGFSNSAFSGSSPYSAFAGDGVSGSASIYGAASASGSNDSSYGYTEKATLQSGSWGAITGTGGASGNATAGWSYSGGGNYWASGRRSSLSGWWLAIG